jgi:hypothetical protein
MALSVSTNLSIFDDISASRLIPAQLGATLNKRAPQKYKSIVITFYLPENRENVKQCRLTG